MGSKLDLPTYNGKMDPNATMGWVHVLTSFLDCEDISENQRVKIAKSRLKGSTLTWWNFIKDDRVNNEKNLVTTWKKRVNLLRETYVPKDYEVQLHKKRMILR